MNLRFCILILFAGVGFHFNKPGSELAKNPASQDTISRNRLTTAEKKDYILSINQFSISASKDTEVTVPIHRKVKYIEVSLQLSNNAAENMVYVDFSCSWEGIFSTDNKGISVEVRPCQYNVPNACYLAAHSSKTFILKLLFAKTVKPGTKFRCSMFVFGFTGGDIDSEFIHYLYQNPNDNLIWSNTVVIP